MKAHIKLIQDSSQANLVRVVGSGQNADEQLLAYFSYLGINYEFINLNDPELQTQELSEDFYIFQKDSLSVFEKKQLNDYLHQNQKQAFPYNFDAFQNDGDDEMTLYLPMRKIQFFSTLNIFDKLVREKQLAKNLEKYIQVNSKLLNLGELTSSVLHDLNNFMMVSSASFSGIKFILDNNLSSDKIEKFCQRGDKAINELMGVANKCQDFLKGDKTIQLETFSLHEICSWLHEMFRTTLQTSQIELRIKVNKSIMLKSDRSILMQSLLNLMKNSIEAIREQKSSKWIEIRFTESISEATIEFIDSGEIEEECLSKAFDINFSGDPQRGSGLGLYLVRKRLQELSMIIELKKTPQTTFIISFPREIVN